MKLPNKILKASLLYQKGISSDFIAAMKYVVKNFDAKRPTTFLANMKSSSCYKNARVWAKKNNADVYTGFLFSQSETRAYKDGKVKITKHWSGSPHVWPVKDGKVVEVTNIGGGENVSRYYVGKKVPESDLTPNYPYFSNNDKKFLTYLTQGGAMFKITAKEKQMIQKRRKVLSAKRKKKLPRNVSPQDRVFHGLDDFRDALVQVINSQEDLEDDLEEAFPKEAKSFLRLWGRIYNYIDKAVEGTEELLDDISDTLD